MGNPLLGESSGPAVVRHFTRRRQAFEPVANDADAMMMDSEINDPHKAWRSTNQAQHRAASPSAFGRKSLSFLEDNHKSVRAAVDATAENAPQPRPASGRSADPDLHGRPTSERESAGAPGSRAHRASSPSRRKTDVTGWSYDTHWTMPAAIMPNGEPSTDPHPPPTHESQPFYTKSLVDEPDRASKLNHPRTTYQPGEVWHPRGSSLRYASSPGNHCERLRAPTAA
jgi:hypothetical protein